MPPPPFGLHTISSGKVTERHAELAKARQYFERLSPSQVYSNEPDDYLYLYQSLFACVRQDAQVWERKASAQGERRLEDAGGVLRLVVEKTIHHTERKAFTALRNHILQSSVFRAQLVTPLALNYAKALDTALAYPPHLEHLRPEEWVQLVFRCFDILLGGRIANETPLDEDFREAAAEGEESMTLEVDGEEVASPTNASTSTSKKRPRIESSSSSPNAKRPRRAQRLIPMTTVQREYASVLKRLFSTSRMHLLDKAIFKDHKTPEREPEGYEVMKRLQRGVLRAFRKFFEVFPGETSGTEDVLCAMNTALSDLELNAKELVTNFGIELLPTLMDIWGIKNPLTKEQLLIAARLLLPFVSHHSVNVFGSHELVARLLRRLEEESDPRTGLEPLSLDSLRLKFLEPDDLPSREEEVPFRRTTFRNGHALTKEQVVTWSAMDVHADCLAKLHEHSEVSFVGKDGERGSKRQRRENPVKTFLSVLEGSQEAEQARVFRLQLLLFFVDRSWTTLHEELQTLIHSQLTALISDPHPSVRSWTMLCLAAIAVQPSTSSSALDWPTVWSLAIRRISTPSTCRSASHLLHAILKSSLLDTQRVLTEISEFSKELSVQGPTFPYDSVCSFLGECLRIANRDATLYLLHIEDKILMWLERTWRIVEGTSGGFGAHTRMEAHAMEDVLGLLGSICQLKKIVALGTRILPPDCRTTDRLLEEHKYAVERNFLLYAELPLPLLAPDNTASEPETTEAVGIPNGPDAPSESPDELIFPDVRQRSCSTFLQNGLDHLLQEWFTLKEPLSTVTSEQLRRMADMVVLALAWEALLTLNGIRFTRKVVQTAAEVLDLLATALTLRTERNLWRDDNPALVLLGLEPLVDRPSTSTEEQKELFVCPGAKSGIRRNVLARVSRRRDDRRQAVLQQRLSLQGIIWRMADLQDATASLLRAFRAYLSRETDHIASNADTSHDDGWAIGQHAAQQTQVGSVNSAFTLARNACSQVCLAYLTRVPAFRLSNTCIDLDKTLLDLVISGINSDSFAVPRQVFKALSGNELRVSIEDATVILNALNDASFQYSDVRSEAFWNCAMDFLQCSLDLWLRQQPHDEDMFFEFAGTAVRACQTYNFRNIPSRIATWLDVYLQSDPSESRWVMEDEKARSILENCATHGDYRVRMRIGSCLGILFETTQSDQQPLDYYNLLFDILPAHTDRFEDMLTRAVILGNIMLPSSEVRKAPYWALISTCLQFEQYSEHVQSILNIVATLLGMTTLVDLFRPYAGQFAFTASQMSHQDDTMEVYDLTKLPKLFGYPDRAALASDCFLLMGPIFLAVSDDSEPSGNFCFRALCSARGVKPEDGMQQCLPKTLGLRIAFFMNNISLDDAAAVPTPEDIQLLNHGLSHHMQHCGIDAKDISQLIPRHMVEIALAILALLLDTDFGNHGASFPPLLKNVTKLGAKFPGGAGVELDSTSAQSTFRALTIDINEDYQMHRPILPALSSLTILRCLLWLNAQFGVIFRKETVYHVVFQLFTTATQASMVNEQVRSLRAAMLYIALCTPSFVHTPVLRSLLRGASALADQIDIGRAIRNFLNWGLQMLQHLGQPDELLPEVLLRVGHAVQSYKKTADPPTMEFSQELESWISQRMADLYEKKELQEAVRNAVTLWPDQSEELFPFCVITISGVQDILLEGPESSDKFPLIEYLSEGTMSEEPRFEGSLAELGFWQLKAALHSDTELKVDHCFAMGDLLFSYSCQLEAVETDTRPVPVALIKYLQDVASQKRRFTDLPSAFYLVAQLSRLLTDMQTDRRIAAYEALRRVMPFLDMDVKILSAATQAEVELIRAYPLGVLSYRDRAIEELLDTVQSERAENYTIWILHISVFLAELHAAVEPVWAQVIPVLRTYPSVAELMLAPLIHAILKREALVEPVDNRPIRALLSTYFTTLLRQSRTAPACTQQIVDVVVYLRHFEIDERNDPLSHDKWLDIDFLLLSKSAASCGAFTTALMLFELIPDNPMKRTQVAEEEEVLYSIYSHIDEPDGFYSIKGRDARKSVIRSMEHEGRWDLALGFHGSMSHSGISRKQAETAATGVIRSLQSLGFDQLAMSLLNSGTDRGASPNMVYDLAWRTDNWDLPDLPSDNTTSAAPLYMALRAVHRERRPEQVDVIIRRAFLRTVEQLKVIPDDDMVSLLQACTTLVCLREVRHWQQPGIQNLFRRDDMPMSQWSDYLRLPSDAEFSTTECIVATRVSLLRAIEQADSAQQIGNLPSPFSKRVRAIERNCLLKLAEAARDAGNVQVALNSVTQAQQLDGSLPDLSTSKEFAHVLWSQGEKKSAIDALTSLVQEQLDSRREGHRSLDSDFSEVAALQADLGWWISQAGLDEGQNINEQYFEPAMTLLSKATSPVGSNHASVYYHYALFADEQYLTIGARDLSRYELYIRRKEQELAWFEAQGYDVALRRVQEARVAKVKPKSTDYALVHKYRSHRDRAALLLRRDEDRYQELVQARSLFLRKAMEMFSKVLRYSDDHDENAAVRFLARWFSHFKDEELNEAIATDLEKVPSHKFVFLVHQLSARMERTVFLPSGQKNLQSLMLRICKEHPFHSLFQVFALGGFKRSKVAAVSEDEASQQGRIDAAAFIHRALSTDNTTGGRIKSVFDACEAYLEWANYPIKAQKPDQSKKHAIPSRVRLLRLINFNIPVATAHTAVDKTMKYQDVVTIQGYDPYFTVAGGNNCPKINTCKGSDGRRYKQLFKGEGGDDLRQDAVMEQVFELVNHLLQHDLQTRKRRLQMRTYRVIPLASQAGLLEFVENTSPLGSWLQAAHLRYNKAEPNVSKIRNSIPQPEAQVPPDKKHKLYLDITKLVRPVMRHYFTEKRKIPAAWFAMRLRYGRSVAVGSVVGHVLGLGDRHLSNILIDNQTGEVVHIDLGIAFEQGTLLPIPETVPFRLTRDIVDGLGTAGTEGVFQRCAENTLRVLRDESDHIKTILEVFRYDPLHSWTASPFQLAKAQAIEVTPTSTAGPPSTASSLFPPSTSGLPSVTNTSTTSFAVGRISEAEVSEELNMESDMAQENADRALKSVADKLDKGLSVEYVINRLINEARDTWNLSQIYSGWLPWY